MRRILFIFFIFTFLLSSININLGSDVTIHIYHLFIPFIVYYLLFKFNEFNKIIAFELFFIMLYFYLAVTLLWANDSFLAMKLIFLELILIVAYFYIRLELQQFSIKQIENFIYKVGKFYIIISLILYALGLYIYHTQPIPNESFYFGLMQESILPRLKGMTSSPNEYIPYGLFFLVYFMSFNNIKFILLTLITIVLSFSTTGMFIAFIIITIYYCNKITLKGILIFIILILTIIILYYFYIQSNQNIMEMIELRIQRNKSGTGRFELWEYSFNLINDNIFGYGINQTRLLIHDFHALNSVHNNIVEVFLTGGFIGLILYLLFLIMLFFQSLKIWIMNNDIKIFLLFIIFVLIGIANNTLHIGYNILYLALLFRYSIQKKEKYAN